MINLCYDFSKENMFSEGHRNVDTKVVGSFENWETKLFSFPRVGNKIKRGVDFRHSARNVLKDELQIGNGVFLS